MKQDWHPGELAQHWTLSGEERALLGNKAGATRLSFAVLLKAFQFEGHFPERREEVVTSTGRPGPGSGGWFLRNGGVTSCGSGRS